MVHLCQWWAHNWLVPRPHCQKQPTYKHSKHQPSRHPLYCHQSRGRCTSIKGNCWKFLDSKSSPDPNIFQFMPPSVSVCISCHFVTSFHSQPYYSRWNTNVSIYMSSLRILKSNPRNPPETVIWRPTDSAVSFGAQSAGVSYDLHYISIFLCNILSVQVEKITITSLKPVYGYHNLLSCRQQFSRSLNTINSNEHKILQEQYGCLFELTPLHLQPWPIRLVTSRGLPWFQSTWSLVIRRSPHRRMLQLPDHLQCFGLENFVKKVVSAKGKHANDNYRTDQHIIIQRAGI